MSVTERMGSYASAAVGVSPHAPGAASNRVTSIESRIQEVIDRWQVWCGSANTGADPLGRLLRDLELVGARREAEGAAEALFRELVVATRSGRSVGDSHRA